MNKIKYFYIILIILFTFKNTFLQAQQVWFVQVSNSFAGTRSISFPNTLTGYAAASSTSSIIKTTDGGFNWVATSPNYALSVAFKDANTGYTCSNLNLDIFDRTTDGGNTWNNTCTVYGVLYQFEFPAVTTIYGTGEPLIGGFGIYYAPHTPPYGAFILGICYNAYESYDSSTIRKMRSEQPGLVWGVGDKGYYVRYNSGYSDGIINSNANFTGVSFGDTLDGFIVGGSYVYKTTNYGGTWTQITPISNGFYYDVKFINKNTGWIVGGQTGVSTDIFHTSDGGINWDIQWSSSGVHATPYDICFASNDTGWVSFFDGTLLKYGIPPIPATPVLTSPPNNSIGLPLSDTLKWNASNFATSYRVQVATDSLFTSLFLNDSTVTTTSRYVTGLSSTTIYWWRVNAKNSGGSSAFSMPFKFTTIMASPPPPVLLSPANNSIGLPLTDTLRWNASTGAVSYRLQVATDSNFTAFILNDSTITANSRIISGLSPLTWYYWRVNAKNAGGTSNYSSVWKFKTIGPVSGVALYTPVNNAVNQPITNLLFTWSHAVEQTVHLTILNYWFALYSDTTQSAIIIDSTLTDTLKIVSGLLNNTNYWWKVRAKSQLGYGPFSSYFHFTTVVAAPGPPTLLSPPNHSIVYTPNPLFDWLPVSAATGYRLQLTLDSTFTTILLDTTVTVDSFMVSGLSENKYYWHVNAQNIGGSSQYSEAWSFTVNLSNIVRNNNEIPKVFKLYNNYPNPFNPVSKIKFDIPKASDVKITIFNTLGQNIASLVDSHLVPGSYSVEWNATIYPSGVYFYKLTAGDFTQTKKMVLIK